MPTDAVAPTVQTLPENAVLVRAAACGGGFAVGLGMKLVAPDAVHASVAEHGPDAVREALVARIESAARANGIQIGLDEESVSEAVDALLAAAAEGRRETVTRKVAEGEAPAKGRDGRVEYALNPDGQSMAQNEEVGPTSRRRWVRMVQQGEVLARLLPPEPGKAGRAVDGSTVEPAQVAEASLHPVMGEGTTVAGDTLVTDTAGACEESASGRLRIVPVLHLENVDRSTGSIPEAGTGDAAVLVSRQIHAGFRVATTECVFVGSAKDRGLIEGGTQVRARSLVTNGPVYGNSGGEDEESGERMATVESDELCICGEVLQARITAGTIIVRESARFAQLDADDAVFIDGDLVGGQVVCRRSLAIAGDAGSEKGGSDTRILVPSADGPSRRDRLRRRESTRLRKQGEALSQELKRIETEAAKRAKVEKFWAALCGGEDREPRTPVEAAILRQYKDMDNERRRLQQNLKALAHDLGRLAREEEEEDLDSEDGVTVTVGGQLHLDVTFEIAGVAEQEDLQRQVDFTLDGHKYRGHELADVHRNLRKAVAAYLETEGKRVSERREAIDQMFEGAGHRPSGPDLDMRVFEHPFRWSGMADDDAELHTECVAIVGSEEPHELKIRTRVRARQTQCGAALTIARDGVQASVQLADGQVRAGEWLEMDRVCDGLDGAAVGSMVARELLTPIPEHDTPTTEGA